MLATIHLQETYWMKDTGISKSIARHNALDGSGVSNLKVKDGLAGLGRQSDRRD